MNTSFTNELEAPGEKIVIDQLMYRSYAFNRAKSPHIEPQRWRQIYINAETYEKIYQEENHESHE